MPEAVDSNSTPTSDGQDKRKRRVRDGVPAYMPSQAFKDLPAHVQKNFSAVEEMLKTHGQLVAATMETGDDFSLYSNGIHLIYRLIFNRLREITSTVDGYISDAYSNHLLTGKSGQVLYERIGRMVASAYAATGIDMDIDKQSDWSDDIWNTYNSTLIRFYDELSEQLGGDTNLLTVGSLLPWLELKIRREICGTLYSDTVGDMRARFVEDMVNEGRSAADISQALNVKRSAVKKIISRLHGEPQGNRKAG